MDSSVSSKDEIWLLRVCDNISTGLYTFNERAVGPQGRSGRFGIVVTNMSRKEKELMRVTGLICVDKISSR